MPAILEKLKCLAGRESRVPVGELSLLEVVRDCWSWTGLRPSLIIDSNDFGDLLVRAADGQIWQIVPSRLTCEVIARDTAALADLRASKEFREDWYRNDILRDLVDAFGNLEAGFAYGFRTPLVFAEGTEDPSNVVIVPVQEVVGLSGDISRKIKDLPDGTNVRFTWAP